jgi:Rod binding domain-containing protein
MGYAVEGYAPLPTPRARATDAELAQAARDMEASFLSIMLREAGVRALRSATVRGKNSSRHF